MKILLSSLLLLSLVSCASQKKSDERDIQANAKASGVSDGKSLGNKIDELINSSRSLSEAQKKELLSIFAINKERAESLTEQSFKLRSVLIKELLSGSIDQKKVDLIKEDIKKVEARRLTNTFDTVEKVTNVVSKHVEHHDDFANHLIQMDRPGRP